MQLGRVYNSPWLRAAVTPPQEKLRIRFHESNIMKRLIYPDWDTKLYQKHKFPQTVPPKLIFGNRGQEVVDEQFNHIREKYKSIDNFIVASVAKSKSYLIGNIISTKE